jgi:hypothetical protein
VRGLQKRADQLEVAGKAAHRQRRVHWDQLLSMVEHVSTVDCMCFISQFRRGSHRLVLPTNYSGRGPDLFPVGSTPLPPP